MEMHERLKSARMNAGFANASQAAEALSVKQQTYLAHENGSRGFTHESAAKYARRYGVNFEWLLTGKGTMTGGTTGSAPEETLVAAPESRARAGVLRIAGEVAAGVWREIDLEAAPEYGDMQAIVDPRYPEREQFLLIVRGTSLNKIARDGDFLHCVGIIGSGVEIQPSDLVIIERSKAEGGLIETTAKRIHRKNGTYELHPESTDPQFQAPVVIPEDGEEQFETIRIIAKVLLISKKP